MRYFLVTRRIDLGLAKVEVFDNENQATKAYDAAERRIESTQARRAARGAVYAAPDEVCLFGADRLGTLLKTHAGWFDEPIDEDLFRQVAALAAAGASRDKHDTGGER